MSDEKDKMRAAFPNLCGALPEGTSWGDELTPTIAMAIWQASRDDADAGADPIARSKRVLTAVDEYHERPNNDTRHALRSLLFKEFTAPPVAAPVEVTDADAQWAAILSPMRHFPEEGYERTRFVDGWNSCASAVRTLREIEAEKTTSVAEPTEVTPAMVRAAMPWLANFQHMRRGDKQSAVEEAIKAALAQRGEPT